ncbi:hypothetical protein ES332_A04G134000v1 [Gossypium tomentosum]|uniref:Uncharacterized protein n=1 Tax=Gossypium tomentosum TaxID=34277 RepID=A0A5D2R1C8_GOSTO|nr:hypothetical protein ES332_A04G134000v1 [Gossypium tomentosum]
MFSWQNNGVQGFSLDPPLRRFSRVIDACVYQIFCVLFFQVLCNSFLVDMFLAHLLLHGSNVVSMPSEQ